MSKTSSCFELTDVGSTVGSANLDWRSFLDNDEINVVILGREFAQ